MAGSERNTVVIAATGHHQAARVIDSKTLMDGERTILISHEGQEYTLRLTRLGKLLLTK
jgi:hemin uptake protein HemP